MEQFPEIKIVILDSNKGLAKNGTLYTTYWVKITIGDHTFRKTCTVFQS